MLHLLTPFIVPVFAAALASVSFTSIAQGDMSDQQTARQAIVRTAEDWKALWSDHSPNQVLPEIDFASQMVVGVFLGTKPTDGWEVEVVGVQGDEDALVVQYAVRQPRRGQMVAQILTQPFHLVAVPRQGDPVRFVQVADPAPPPAPTQR